MCRNIYFFPLQKSAKSSVQASGLPMLLTHVLPSCTYEGENTVLYLQTARLVLWSVCTCGS